MHLCQVRIVLSPLFLDLEVLSELYNYNRRVTAGSIFLGRVVRPFLFGPVDRKDNYKIIKVRIEDLQNTSSPSMSDISQRFECMCQTVSKIQTVSFPEKP